MIMTITINNDNAYSLSAAAATTTSATNRRGGRCEEYKDALDYNDSQVQHNNDKYNNDDEFGLMGFTAWADLY
eukprot:3002487-Ditylum_brightwellii.AAC.1